MLAHTLNPNLEKDKIDTIAYRESLESILIAQPPFISGIEIKQLPVSM